MNIGDTYNGTTRVDRVDGANMIIEQRSARQIATLAGEANVWVSSMSPDVPSMSGDQVESLVTKTDEILAELDNSSYTYAPLSRSANRRRSADMGPLEPRGLRAASLVLVPCPFETEEHDAICVFLFCVKV